MKLLGYFLKNGPILASSKFIFVMIQIQFKHRLINEDGVFWTQTQGGRMEGADESTELWRHPSSRLLLTV